MKRGIVLVIVCLLGLLVLSLLTSGQEENNVEVVFLDIGQGDATLITFENGQRMLIDCAIDARILEALGRHMNFYERTIDYLVVTHPDLDHYGGCASVMKRFAVNHIFYTGKVKHNSVFEGFRAAVKEEQEQGGEYIIIAEPHLMSFPESAVTFLFPNRSLHEDEDSNNSSIVQRLDVFGTSVLLTADAEKELESYLLAAIPEKLDVDILKLGHHGSTSSSIEPFLEATSPKEAVASAGEKNHFGHPSERVLRRAERHGARTWRTDTQGDIILHIQKDSYHMFSQY